MNNEVALRDSDDNSFYPYWLKQDGWTAMQALILLCGGDPALYNPDGMPKSPETPKIINGQLMEMLSLAIELNIIFSHDPFFLLGLNSDSVGKDLTYLIVFPHEVVQWAQQKGFDIPEALAVLLPKERSQDNPHKDIRTRDKEKFQNKADRVWGEHPDYTAVDIVKDSKMKPPYLVLERKKKYERRTLEQWAREVNPRSPEHRMGRPKKRRSKQ